MVEAGDVDPGVDLLTVTIFHGLSGEYTQDRLPPPEAPLCCPQAPLCTHRIVLRPLCVADLKRFLQTHPMLATMFQGRLGAVPFRSLQILLMTDGADGAGEEEPLEESAELADGSSYRWLTKHEYTRHFCLEFLWDREEVYRWFWHEEWRVHEAFLGMARTGGGRGEAADILPAGGEAWGRPGSGDVLPGPWLMWVWAFLSGLSLSVFGSFLQALARTEHEDLLNFLSMKDVDGLSLLVGMMRMAENGAFVSWQRRALTVKFIAEMLGRFRGDVNAHFREGGAAARVGVPGDLVRPSWVPFWPVNVRPHTLFAKLALFWQRGAAAGRGGLEPETSAKAAWLALLQHPGFSAAAFRTGILDLNGAQGTDDPDDDSAKRRLSLGQPLHELPEAVLAVRLVNNNSESWEVALAMIEHPGCGMGFVNAQRQTPPHPRLLSGCFPSGGSAAANPAPSTSPIWLLSVAMISLAFGKGGSAALAKLITGKNLFKKKREDEGVEQQRALLAVERMFEVVLKLVKHPSVVAEHVNGAFEDVFLLGGSNAWVAESLRAEHRDAIREAFLASPLLSEQNREKYQTSCAG